MTINRKLIIKDVDQMTISDNKPERVGAPRNKESINIPFKMKILLICDDNQVNKGIESILGDQKNIELDAINKLSFITTGKHHIALLVYTGNETQSKNDIKKLSNAGINLILIGDDLPAELLRTSIQLSIKDCLPLKTLELNLLSAISRISELLISDLKLAPVISILNGKGGSGSSFITNSISQVINKNSNKQIALIDADLQHGSLANSLNLQPEYYLDDALNDVKELDETAVKSMMSKRQNIHLLPVRAYSQLNQLVNINANSISQLLGKIRLSYELLIADLSRGLDSLSIPIVEISDHIFIVLQQNITSIRESKALIEQLQNKMGISAEKINIIINRFSDKHSSITADDIRKATGINSVFKISNDYELANACTDLGKSLEELSNSKSLEKEVIHLLNTVNPLDVEFNKKPTGFWAKLIGKE